MAWSILLILVAVLFAVGFIWPGIWFFAAGVFVIWVIAMIVGGGRGRGRDGRRSSVEGERPRHRVE
jgi:hypothetical protein